MTRLARFAALAPCARCGRETPHTRRGKCSACGGGRKATHRKTAAPKRGARPRAQRKSTVAALKRRLWTLFAAYVKERDGNTCFSCGRSGLKGTNWHAGHMFPAGSSSLLRYDPLNVHSQCYHCNINLGGNGARYAVAFMQRYGTAQFAALNIRARELKAWRAPELTELIAALKRGGADYELLYAERYR